MQLHADHLSKSDRAFLDHSPEWTWFERHREEGSSPLISGYYAPQSGDSELWPIVFASNCDVIEWAAGTYNGLNPRSRTSHSPGVLMYLRTTLARPLPDPQWLNDG